jgi:biotin/lipoyl-binding protein
MIRKYGLPVLAIIGVVIAAITVLRGNRPAPAAAPIAEPAKAPFASYIAGAGIVEASTENIAAGTPVSGIVTAIYVKWGEQVKAGDPLFKIDDRDMQGQLLPALAKVQEAEANLAMARSELMELPRFSRRCRAWPVRDRRTYRSGASWLPVPHDVVYPAPRDRGGSGGEDGGGRSKRPPGAQTAAGHRVCRTLACRLTAIQQELRFPVDAWTFHGRAKWQNGIQCVSRVAAGRVRDIVFVFLTKGLAVVFCAANLAQLARGESASD